MKNQEDRPTAAAAATLRPPQANWRSRILVVEDDSAVLRLGVRLLRSSGYDVEAVKDGAAGWDVLQSGHYDLIITDNAMPRLSGVEMIAKIHAAGMRISVITATGTLPETEFERHLWFIPAGTLIKPYSAEALLKIVVEVLRATNGGHLPPGPPQLEPVQPSLHDAQMKEAEARTAQANTRTAEAEMRVVQANTRTEQSEAQTVRAETSERKMRASEMSYRRLFEAAKDGIMILEVETGRITDVNQFIIDLLGFSLAEMLGRTVGELSPFKDIESNRVMLARLQQEGYVRYDDLPLETKDGRKIAVEFISNVYQAGDGNVIQCNIRDLTGHKQMQLVLNRMAAIVESSDDAIIGKTPSGIITTWNRAAEKIFGYTAAEMVGTSFARMIPADRLNEENEILEKLRRGESVDHFETLRQTRDGRLIDVSVTASSIKDAGGNIVGVSKVARDISERKRAEQKILQLNEELERRVVDRTAQLQQANEELESFSYSVSHDLRAPLRHVAGFVEMLKLDAGPSLSEPNRQLLTKISHAAKQMSNLIDDLLAFAHIRTSEIVKSEVRLDQLVQEAMGDFKEDTKERNIVWKIHPLPVVQGDRALLRMVLVNLISNAVKFTGERTEAIIEIGSIPGGDDGTVIFIRDNGAGFDPRYGHKLFGVFQRLHRQDEFEGTGMGLANVRRIIRRNGGRTWAEGVKDGGATFYFSFPKPDAGALAP